MFRVAPPSAVQLHRCAGRVGNYRRRDFVFPVIPGVEFPRLNIEAEPSTPMTIFAHTQLDARWPADARRARARAMSALGCGASACGYEGVVQPLYRITEQEQPIERSGTGSVGRRRKR